MAPMVLSPIFIQRSKPLHVTDIRTVSDIGVIPRIASLAKLLSGFHPFFLALRSGQLLNLSVLVGDYVVQFCAPHLSLHTCASLFHEAVHSLGTVWLGFPCQD